MNTESQPSAHVSADAVAMMRYDNAKKSVLVAYLLWFFLGYFGVHRFYTGNTGSGAAMLVICLLSFALSIILVGFIGFAIIAIWCFVDIFLIPGMVKAYNDKVLLGIIK